MLCADKWKADSLGEMLELVTEQAKGLDVLKSIDIWLYSINKMFTKQFTELNAQS